MNKVTLVARKPFGYAGKSLRPGDTFEATAQHAKILVAVRRAEISYAPAAPIPAPVKGYPRAAAVPAAPKKKRVYKRKDMQAETTETEKKPKKKRVYKRKDMQAETTETEKKPKKKRVYKRKDMKADNE